MNKVLFLAALCLILLACNKDDETATDFTLNSTNAYREEEIELGLAPQPGVTYSVNFGDTSFVSTGNPKHIYRTPGIYTITVTAGTSSTSKRIRVFPGTASYQVQNKYPGTSFKVFNSAAIDDKYLYAPTYQKSELAFNQITDTVFVQHSTVSASKLYITFNWKNPFQVNVQFMINSGFNLTKGSHKIFTIDAATNGAFSGNEALYYYNKTGSIATADNLR